MGNSTSSADRERTMMTETASHLRSSRVENRDPQVAGTAKERVRHEVLKMADGEASPSDKVSNRSQQVPQSTEDMIQPSPSSVVKESSMPPTSEEVEKSKRGFHGMPQANEWNGDEHQSIHQKLLVASRKSRRVQLQKKRQAGEIKSASATDESTTRPSKRNRHGETTHEPRGDSHQTLNWQLRRLKDNYSNARHAAAYTGEIAQYHSPSTGAESSTTHTTKPSPTTEGEGAPIIDTFGTMPTIAIKNNSPTKRARDETPMIHSHVLTGERSGINSPSSREPFGSTRGVDGLVARKRELNQRPEVTEHDNSGVEAPFSTRNAKEATIRSTFSKPNVPNHQLLLSTPKKPSITQKNQGNGANQQQRKAKAAKVKAAKSVCNVSRRELSKADAPSPIFATLGVGNSGTQRKESNFLHTATRMSRDGNFCGELPSIGKRIFLNDERFKSRISFPMDNEPVCCCRMDFVLGVDGSPQRKHIGTVIVIEFLLRQMAKMERARAKKFEDIEENAIEFDIVPALFRFLQNEGGQFKFTKFCDITNTWIYLVGAPGEVRLYFIELLRLVKRQNGSTQWMKQLVSTLVGDWNGHLIQFWRDLEKSKQTNRISIPGNQDEWVTYSFCMEASSSDFVFDKSGCPVLWHPFNIGLLECVKRSIRHFNGADDTKRKAILDKIFSVLATWKGALKVELIDVGYGTVPHDKAKDYIIQILSYYANQSLSRENDSAPKKSNNEAPQKHPKQPTGPGTSQRLIHNSPTHLDVLQGRTPSAYNSPGNKYLNALILDRVETYFKSSKKIKHRLLKSMVNAIYSRGGRFLRQNNKQWYEVSDEQARQKVSHLFRDLEPSTALRRGRKQVSPYEFFRKRESPPQQKRIASLDRKGTEAANTPANKEVLSKNWNRVTIPPSAPLNMTRVSIQGKAMKPAPQLLGPVMPMPSLRTAKTKPPVVLLGKPSMPEKGIKSTLLHPTWRRGSQTSPLRGETDGQPEEVTVAQSREQARPNVVPERMVGLTYFMKRHPCQYHPNILISITREMGTTTLHPLCPICFVSKQVTQEGTTSLSSLETNVMMNHYHSMVEKYPNTKEEVQTLLYGLDTGKTAARRDDLTRSKAIELAHATLEKNAVKLSGTVLKSAGVSMDTNKTQVADLRGQLESIWADLVKFCEQIRDNMESQDLVFNNLIKLRNTFDLICFVCNNFSSGDLLQVANQYLSSLVEGLLEGLFIMSKSLRTNLGDGQTSKLRVAHRRAVKALLSVEDILSGSALANLIPQQVALATQMPNSNTVSLAERTSPFSRQQLVAPKDSQPLPTAPENSSSKSTQAGSESYSVSQAVPTVATAPKSAPPLEAATVPPSFLVPKAGPVPPTPSIPEAPPISIIIYGMKEKRSDVGHQKDALALLERFCSGTEQRGLFFSAGGVEVVLETMRTHSTNIEVQRLCCIVLGNAGTNHKDNQVAIAKANGIPDVCAAMRLDGGAGIQAAACFTLASLSENHEENQVTIAAFGGIYLVVNAMKSHPEDVLTQWAACHALGNLALRNPSNQLEIAVMHGVRQIIEAMKRHYKSEQLQRFATYALCRLVWENSENANAMDAMDGMSNVFHAMTLYPKNLKLQEDTVVILGQMASCGEHLRKKILKKASWISEFIMDAEGVSQGLKSWAFEQLGLEYPQDNGVTAEDPAMSSQ